MQEYLYLLHVLRTRMSLCNSRGSAIRRRLVRVINKMVADAATQYFVKCNNNLCNDRIYAERKRGSTSTMPINFAYFITLTMRLPKQNSRLYRPIIAMWNLNEDTSGRHIIRQGLRLHIEKFAIDGEGENGRGRGYGSVGYIYCRNRRVTGFLHAIILISRQNGLLLLKTVAHKRLFRNSTCTEYEAEFNKYAKSAKENYDIDFASLASNK